MNFSAKYGIPWYFKNCSLQRFHLLQYIIIQYCTPREKFYSTLDILPFLSVDSLPHIFVTKFHQSEVRITESPCSRQKQPIAPSTMRFSSAALLLLAQAVSSQDGSCSVCGDGLAVTLPSAIFSFPGQPSAECGLLEQAGEAGQISPETCLFLPDLIEETCGCETATRPERCSVCGPGNEVSIPDAVFLFPGQPSVPCSTLEEVAEQGVIPLDQCVLLPTLIGGLCGCIPIAGGDPTFAPIAPTMSPTGSPVTSRPTSSAPLAALPTLSPMTISPVDPPMLGPISPAPVRAPVSLPTETAQPTLAPILTPTPEPTPRSGSSTQAPSRKSVPENATPASAGASSNAPYFSNGGGDDDDGSDKKGKDKEPKSADDDTISHGDDDDDDEEEPGTGDDDDAGNDDYVEQPGKGTVKDGDSDDERDDYGVSGKGASKGTGSDGNYLVTKKGSGKGGAYDDDLAGDDDGGKFSEDSTQYKMKHKEKTGKGMGVPKKAKKSKAKETKASKLKKGHSYSRGVKKPRQLRR
jgi:hypothetical protein